MAKETIFKKTKAKPPEVPRVKPEPVKVDSGPPHSEEAELGILSSCLQDPRTALNLCIEQLGGPDDFYDARHGEVYRAMLELNGRGEVVDQITLRQLLKDKNLLEPCGGDAFLARLPDAAPSAANVENYIAVVVGKATLRHAITVCREALGTIATCEGDVNGVIDLLEQKVLDIRGKRISSNVVDVKTVVLDAISVIEQRFMRQGAIAGISTGLVDLDKLTQGQIAEQLTVLAGFPSSGKSALAGNLVEASAINQNIPTAFFSLEMPSCDLAARMMASQGRVNLLEVRDNLERDFPKLSNAADRVRRAPIFFDDTPGLSVYQLRAKARRLVQQFGVKFIVIDYLQLLSAEGGPNKPENRQTEVAAISRNLKGMSRELKVPVLVLSQLNNDGNLRESAAIGQDGDNVWVLEKSDPEDESDCCEMDLRIRKQRNGPAPKTVRLTFFKQYTRFENMARESGYGDHQKD